MISKTHSLRDAINTLKEHREKLEDEIGKQKMDCPKLTFPRQILEFTPKTQPEKGEKTQLIFAFDLP